MKADKLLPMLASAYLFGLIFGCTAEEEQVVPQTDTIENETKGPFEKVFTLEYFKEKEGILNGELTVDWGSPITKKMKNGRTLYEFRATPIAPSFLESEIQLPDQIVVLGELDGNNKAHTWILKIKPDITSAPIDYSYLYLEDYSGSIYHYNLQGNVLRMEGWQKGKGMSLVDNADQAQEELPDHRVAICQQRTSLANMGPQSEPFDTCPGGGGGSWTPVYMDHYTDWYLNRGNGVLEYSNTEYNGRTTEWVWVSNGDGTGLYQGRFQYYRYNLNNGSSQRLNSRPNLEIPYKIINKLTGKALCVFNKLALSSTGLKSALKKFDGNFPVAHLKIDMGDIGTAKGITIAPGASQLTPDYVITIRLNSNNTVNGVKYRPNLIVAKTIIHEAIHAEMYRKLLSLANQGNLDFTGWSQQQQTNYMISIRDNFPGIYDYYRRHKNWQHQQMATHYRQTIAEAIKDFDNSQHSNQFYLDLAWEGLRYADISAWNNISQQEKDRINSIIDDYITNNNNQNCTP